MADENKHVLSLSSGPQPRKEIVQLAKDSVAINTESFLEFAPPLPKVWVGREELLSILTYDWLDDKAFVAGLVGFAGEGKSSIALKWVDQILHTDILNEGDKPDSIFFWSFYSKNSTVDLFFEKALRHLSNQELDLNPFPSAHSRAELLAGVLKAKRYLFILDGLERLQYLGGEDHGLLKSNDLAKFLEYFASGGHQSFCLITSRARATNLAPYRTYTQFDVERLTDKDGCKLLSDLGVQAEPDELQKIVKRWSGHALALTLLARHAAHLHHPGDLSHAVLYYPPEKEQDNKSKLVKWVMLPYDEHLELKQRRFMQIFCLFRLPVPKSALKSVFQVEVSIAEELIDYYLLRYDSEQSCYITHPLIKEFYLEQLQNPSQERSYNGQDLHFHSHRHKFSPGQKDIASIHHRIADYYLSLDGDKPGDLDLDNLSPAIEAVHHLCQAKDFGEAKKNLLEPASKGASLIEKLNRLGAYETEFLLLQDFFPDKDISYEPQVRRQEDKLSILFKIGESLTNLGRMAEALPIFEESNRLAENNAPQENMIKGCLSLAKSYVYLGEFSQAQEAANQALSLAGKDNEKRYAIVQLALIAYLRGQIEESGQWFDRARSFPTKNVYKGKPFLHGIQGVIYLDYLLYLVDESLGTQDNESDILQQAKFVVEANLSCDKPQSKDDLSRLYRIQGDLETIEGAIEDASRSYSRAVEIVRSITHWPALIGILSARGRWIARVHGDAEAARSDLEEALEHAITGGYLLYEIDIYTGLAWASYVGGDFPSAWNKANQAVGLSRQVGYFLGMQKATEVIDALEQIT